MKRIIKITAFMLILSISLSFISCGKIEQINNRLQNENKDVSTNTDSNDNDDISPVLPYEFIIDDPDGLICEPDGVYITENHYKISNFPDISSDKITSTENGTV